MCLIIFSNKAHEKYKLVIASNRDEFYERPTKPADFWDNTPDILGGIDLTAGGTWMGLTKKGKISMLTNYRDIKNIRIDAPSRGHLVSDFLKNAKEGKEYLESINLGRSIVEIESTRRTYKLDVSRVDESELRAAKKILKKMNYDDRFDLVVV